MPERTIFPISGTETTGDPCAEWTWVSTSHDIEK